MRNIKYILTFAATVHTTLPVRTASQGVSFAFIAFVNCIISTFKTRNYVY